MFAGEDLVPEPSFQVQEDPETVPISGTVGFAAGGTTTHDTTGQPGNVPGNSRVERGEHPDTSADRAATERPRQPVPGAAATTASTTPPGAAGSATFDHAGAPFPSTPPRLRVAPVVRSHVGGHFVERRARGAPYAHTQLV